MESTIRIEYSGIHNGLDCENKRPIIKIETKQSDDARDSLLCDLITSTSQIGFRELKPNSFVLYAKNRHQQVCEIAESVFFTLKHLNAAFEATLIIGSDAIYFEDASANTKYKRSESLNRNESLFMQDDEIRKVLVELFINFKH